MLLEIFYRNFVVLFVLFSSVGILQFPQAFFNVRLLLN